MPISEDQLVYLPNVQVTKQSLKTTVTNGLAVCTPSHIFVVPEGAIGTFVVANVFTKYFPDKDVRGGVEQLLADASDVGEIESKMTEMLKADEETDLVFPLDELEKFKVHTWWFNMVTLKRSKKSVNRLVIKGKEHKTRFKALYRERLGLAAQA